MLNNKKATEKVMSLVVIVVPIMLLLLFFLIYMFSKGVATPWNKATACPEEGVWMSKSCDILVSTERTIASDKDHENDQCCVPIEGKEVDFKKWVATSGAASTTGDTNAKPTSTVSFGIGSKDLSPGQTIKIEENAEVDVVSVKNSDVGNFCTFSIIKAQKSAGRWIPVNENDYLVGPTNYDPCSDGQLMDLGKITFAIHDPKSESEEKGMYIVELKVYDKNLNLDIADYQIYVQAVEIETEK